MVNVAEKVAELHDIAPLQRDCDDFKHIIKYLESNTVPEDRGLAQQVIVVAENQFVIDNDVLYHIFYTQNKQA